MDTNLIGEISAKSAALPLEKQREVLNFVEFMLQKSAGKAATEGEQPRAFETMEGSIPRQIENIR